MGNIGIIGAGVMGTDIAHAFAQFGHNVILVDHDSNQLEKSRAKIKQNIRMQKLQGIMTTPSTYEQLLSNISFHTDIRDLSFVDYVIENVTEDWEIKKRVHQGLNQCVGKDVVIAANTSAIPITRFASVYAHRERIIGMHFMNPAYLMPTVEVIPGCDTSQTVIERTRDLLSSIGKKGVVVNDSPGFVTNRAMMVFINEAIYCLYEKVASPEEIDLLFKECFGHKMGPLQTADLIGLDTILKSLEVIYHSFNDDKYRPCFLLKQMVDAGRLGVKSGRGFYEYLY